METKPLISIADVITGIPFSRVSKPSKKAEPARVEVLLPQAVTADGIDDGQVESRTVYGAGGSFFTKEGDVVLKASTPFSCVFIDAIHAGLLVTSTCLIIRSREAANNDMRYLAAYLSGGWGLKELRALSKGTSVKAIKKRDLEGLPIPALAPDARRKVAEVHSKVYAIKSLCRSFECDCDLLLASELDRQLQNADN